MKKIVSLLTILLCAGAWAQTPLQQYVDRIAEDPVLRGALLGVMVRDGNGAVLAERGAREKLVPASNLKLFTTGAALHELGPEYRFRTGIGYTGAIEDGILHGDVYIVGGGDPTLGMQDSLSLRNDALFWRWKSQLKAAGIRSIDGRIIGDGRRFEGHLENSSWTYDDTGTYYGTGCNALSFYANAIDYSVSASAVEGTPVVVRQVYPETPWIHFQNYTATAPAGTGNSLYLFTTDLAPYAEMRGTFAVDRKAKTEHFSNKYGALTCAYYFWKNLVATGWAVSGGYADIDRSGQIRLGQDFSTAGPAGTPVVVGYTESAPLRAIARVTNVRSDNFYAESLYRTLGEENSRWAVYDSCRVAVYKVLEEIGLRPEDGLQMEDGSGLSRQNYLSPAMMADYLAAMEKSPAFEAFLASFPTPGEGTLRGVLKQAPDPSRYRLKSGSMNGVLCYSGYILVPGGRPVIVSIMVNNCTARTSEIRSLLEGILLKAAL